MIKSVIKSLGVVVLLAGCEANQQVGCVDLEGGLVQVEAHRQWDDLCLADRGATVISDAKLQASFGQKASKFEGDDKTLDLTELREQLSKAVKDKSVCKLRLKKERKKEMSGDVMYEKYLDSVLMVGKTYKCSNPRCTKTHANIASGFMLTDDGVFITNHHVADGDFGGKAKGMYVMNGKGKMWAIDKVLAADKVNDFAIIQLKGKGFKGLPLRGDVKPGEKIRAFTHPASRFFTMTEGIVARKYFMQGRGGKGGKNAWLNIDADYCKGSSGGPIFDRFGNVVGIVSSTSSIYYTENRKTGQQNNLQMVFKNVPSAENFLKRIKSK